MFAPSSQAQYAASLSDSVPAVEAVRDDVWSVPSAMPGEHIPCSFISVLRDSRGGIHLIDAGFDTDDNWRALENAITSIGSGMSDVKSVTVTHQHIDHLGLAGRIRQASGALVQLHSEEARALARVPSPVQDAASLAARLDEWDVPLDRRAEMAGVAAPPRVEPAIPVDTVLEDGDRLDIPGFDVLAMHIPGHTTGHLCLREDFRALLFTGDHLLPTMYPGLGLGGTSSRNPIADYLAGLDLVAAFPDHEVLPGHGYRFMGVAARADQTRQHHLVRSREVSRILAEQGDPTIWRIAEQLTWTTGWPNLRGFYAYSALSQTAMHRDYLASIADS